MPVAAWRLVALALLAAVFFLAVSTFKLDRDPANDCRGKCVLVASMAGLMIGLNQARHGLRLRPVWHSPHFPRSSPVLLFLWRFLRPPKPACRAGFRRLITAAL